MLSKNIKFQAQDRRIKNFKEVSLGFSQGNALEEAREFPQYSDPNCRPKCPLGVDITGFIRILREGDARGALKKIQEENDLPGICGRVCAAPCEVEFAVETSQPHTSIRALERYASDRGRPWGLGRKTEARSGKKVAVVGSGPAGLVAAARLAQKNVQVTIFEALPKPGGVLQYGIPSFRLPKEILQREIDAIKRLGVNIVTNSYVGYAVPFSSLQEEGLAAIMLAVGRAGVGLWDLPGAHYRGVYYSQEVLFHLNSRMANVTDRQAKIQMGKNVLVLGSDSAALDCARVCRRLGANATIMCEGAEEEFGCYALERELARQEGVHFEALTQVLEIVSDNGISATGVQCRAMDYADVHSTGQWQIVPVPDSERFQEADTIIIADGPRRKMHIPTKLPGFVLNDDGTIKVKEGTHLTSLEGIFAAGDCVGGRSSLIQAMSSGKKAAEEIEEYLLKGKK